MIYRDLGKTGISAGIIGLGGEYLEGQDQKSVMNVIHAAMDSGINIIDIFMSEPEVRTHIGAALKGRREKMIIQGQICTAWKDGQYVKTRDPAESKFFLEDLFKRLQTDYIDIGMIHYCDTEEDMELLQSNGLIDYCLQLKKQGRFRKIGIACHNSTIAKQLVNMDIFDVLMFSINPAMDMIYNHYTIDDFFGKLDAIKDGFEAPGQLDVDLDRVELYNLCQEKGVGITVMKTLGGGRLLAAESSPFKVPMSVPQCIHYALSRPAVASVLIGAKSTEEVAEALTYLTVEEKEKDYSSIFDSITEYQGNTCLYCGHCLPCPACLNISEITKTLDQAKASGINDALRQTYAGFQAKASACIQCGVCEKRCPFGVSIMKNMREAVVTFE
ncbi:MAG: aldo/keto reductase [Clostridia bacterium]|nr:aldo/keto reductase [Clostridia bacterium]